MAVPSPLILQKLQSLLIPAAGLGALGPRGNSQAIPLTFHKVALLKPASHESRVAQKQQHFRTIGTSSALGGGVR
jgi:hypothetical protein